MAVETPHPAQDAQPRLAELAERFREALAERVLATDIAHEQLTVTVDAASWPQVVRFCKQDLGMTFFDWLSGIDEREDGFSVVAHVYNHVTRQGVLLRAMVPGGREAPRFPTVTDVYRGADWHERETYDMFGIVFEGHPALLPRLLTVENFEGWPLRKEFKLASRIVKPWPGAKEPAEQGEEEGGASATSAKPDPGPAPGQDPGDRAAAAKAKAERAKAKAAEARKRKAEEKAAAQASENPTGSEDAGSASPPDDKAAAQAGEGGAAAQAAGTGTDGSIDDAEPGSAREAQQAAAGQPTAAHTPDPTTPEGASKIADTAIAKDAAAGATAGQEVAPGEQPDSAEPERDAATEAEVGAGGPAQDSGAPGVEKEGTHDLASSTARTDVSDQPDPDDVAARADAGLGPEGTGTFADSTRPDHPDGSAGADVNPADVAPDEATHDDGTATPGADGSTQEGEDDE